VGYSLDSNDVSTKAEESPLLVAVSKQRLVKTKQAGGDLAFANYGNTESVTVICIYDL
jgi:hypothetical protein